jgi:hypothetical protein
MRMGSYAAGFFRPAKRMPRVFKWARANVPGHAGRATATTKAFSALSPAQKNQLPVFLNSLSESLKGSTQGYER